MKKALPSAITSYDLIKAAAVIIMVIDHVGFYFFPYDEWWRAVGRIGFPVWFFFVGHASGRDFPFWLIAGAAILAAVSAAVSMPVFPMNALVTIILIRLLLDPMMAFAGRGTNELAMTMFVLVMLTLVTSQFTEYGTLGLLFALFGYVVRHRESFLGGRNVRPIVMLACFAAFAILQQMTFAFSPVAFAVMAAGTLVTCLTMMMFRPREFPALSARIPAIFKAPVQWMGRHTLAIYIGHLVLFKVAVAILYPDVYPLFQFRLFP